MTARGEPTTALKIDNSLAKLWTVEIVALQGFSFKESLVSWLNDNVLECFPSVLILLLR